MLPLIRSVWVCRFKVTREKCLELFEKPIRALVESYKNTLKSYIKVHFFITGDSMIYLFEIICYFFKLEPPPHKKWGNQFLLSTFYFYTFYLTFKIFWVNLLPLVFLNIRQITKITILLWWSYFYHLSLIQKVLGNKKKNLFANFRIVLQILIFFHFFPFL